MSDDGAVLGIDVGTTQVKVGAVTFAGRVLGIGRSGYPVERPRPGWAEQDPDAWWAAIVAATRAALAAAPPGTAAAIRAIAVVGQGPTTVCTDAAGVPLRPAITWLDTRAAELAGTLGRAIGISSWQLGPLPHERWIATHAAELHARTAHFLGAWDWVTLRLSGEAIRAVTPGSGQPTDATLRAGGADPARFGRPVGWSEVVGTLLAGPAAELGLPPGIHVVAGGNDAFASFHGAAMTAPGDAVDTGGTSGGFGVYADRPLELPGTYLAPAALPGTWILGGAMNATGRALAWLGEVSGGPDGAVPMDRLIAEAAAVPPGADGLVFLPYLAGERSPVWDARARGVFAGLTLTHGRGHLARAVLEGAAFALRHVAEPIVGAGVHVRSMVVSGTTGATRAWSVMKADITGFPVAIPEVPETALLGAAILGALGAGAWPDPVGAIVGMVRIAERIDPDPALADLYAARYAAYRALYPATAPIVHGLGPD
ncbi:MAG: FGGY-family carbohydrate kinase [Chloroflexota bacterium]